MNPQQLMQQVQALQQSISGMSAAGAASASPSASQRASAAPASSSAPSGSAPPPPSGVQSFELPGGGRMFMMGGGAGAPQNVHQFMQHLADQLTNDPNINPNANPNQPRRGRVVNVGNLFTNLAAGLGGGAGGGAAFGDFGVGNLQNIVDELFFRGGGNRGKPPASERAVQELVTTVIVDDAYVEHHAGTSHESCAVCKDDFVVGDELRCMPCGHHYHPDCILPWLRLHNTCPTCRYELPTDDASVDQAQREQAFFSTENTNPSSMNTFSGFGGGSNNNGGGGGFQNFGGGQGGGGGFMKSAFSPSGASSSPSRRMNNDQPLVPVTAKQLKASLDAANNNLVIDGRQVQTVTMVGQIMSIEKLPTRLNYLIDDGTGVIRMVRYIDAEDGGAVAGDAASGDDVVDPDGLTARTYVRLYGNAKVFQNDVSVMHNHIRRVTDFNEISCHILETITSHLYATQGSKTAGVIGSAGAASSSSSAAASASGALVGAGVPAGNGFSAVQSAVMAVFANDHSEVGTKIDVVCSQLPQFTAQDIRGAIEFLSSEGHLYSTIDEEHYKSTDA